MPSFVKTKNNKENSSNVLITFADTEILQAHDEKWNITALTDYIIKTYRAENIIRDVTNNKSMCTHFAVP